MYEVIEDTRVLFPNKEHKNFTDSGEVVVKGTKLEGSPIVIKGKRRGEDFNYKLFRTNEGKLLYINKLRPMAVEVTLNADGGATEIKMPNENKMSFVIATVAVVGAGAGYFYARKKGMDTKKQLLAAAIGGLAGYFVGRYVDNKGILITRK